jgi:hypothetical protein
MRFQLYGRPATLAFEDKAVKLDEVTIRGEPQALRCLARFWTSAAEEIERHGDQFGYEHYQFFVERESDAPFDQRRTSIPRAP